MPQFLENKLRNEARAKGLKGRRADNYVYGTENAIGAMHGNKITAKGREMEKKHEEDKNMKHEPMREMRIEIHREASKDGKPGKLTGFTVHHHMVPKPHGKSQAFYEDNNSQHPFSADDHAGMMAHVNKHMKGQISGAGNNAAMDNAKEEEEEAVEAGE